MRFDQLHRLVLELPGVRERFVRGERSFLAGGRLFLRFKDENTVVVRTDHYERAHLVSRAPSAFFVTDQIREHPWVFVRVARADATVLSRLARDAWRRVAPRRVVATFDSEPNHERT